MVDQTSSTTNSESPPMTNGAPESGGQPGVTSLNGSEAVDPVNVIIDKLIR